MEIIDGVKYQATSDRMVATLMAMQLAATQKRQYCVVSRKRLTRYQERLVVLPLAVAKAKHLTIIPGFVW